MVLLLSKVPCWRMRLLVGLTLCTLATPVIAGQTQTAGQMPEGIRGAKIYRLPTKGGQPAPNPGLYRSLSFQEIKSDRLILNLFVSIRPVDRPATVERMYFQNAAVNGIPVHIETFDQEFKLSRDGSIDLPSSLNCTIVFADLDSLQPLRDMVEKDKIQITGQSFIEIKLNSLEKLALRAKRVVIPVSLNEDVPLNFFQGNPLLRTTAETILNTLSNPGSVAAISMAKEHLAKLRMDQSMGEKAKSALYLLYTEYRVRDPKSNVSEQFAQCGTGFLVSESGKLLTTKRVIAPWKFDPQIDFLLEQQHLELDQSSVKTYAWPAGVQVMSADGQPDFRSALSTDKQTLKILQITPDAMVPQEYQDPDSGEKATLHLHTEGMSDVALLQLSGTGFKPLAIADSGASLAADAKLVLCSYPIGLSQPPIGPRLLSVRAKPEGSVLTMDHKADPGESGAPLLNADGKVVGMATAANQCIPVEAARRFLP